MKIAIVGAGNAGCITALHYYKNLIGNFEIEIYHSPEKHPIEQVGQGTILGVPRLISSTLNINWFNNPIGATFKSGILYEGWGKKNEFIFTTFDSIQDNAIHLVPHKLSKLVLESGYFNVIEKTIIDPEKEIDANYIFDCRGRHNRNPNNYEKLINPLNSVLLYNKLGRDPDLLYTKSVATPHGWTFIIPNQDSVSYGYLYNDIITSTPIAREDCLERFNLYNIDETKLSFDNYIAKNIFVGERTILQGNMCGFVEPLEATALAFYQQVCRQVWDVMFDKINIKVANDNVRRIMREIETFILWHYQYGSKYDTPFWQYAKSLIFNPDKKFKDMLNSSEEKYGQWKDHNFNIWREGVE